MNMTLISIVVESFAGGKKTSFDRRESKIWKDGDMISTTLGSGKNMEQRAGVASRNIFISSQLAAQMKIRMQWWGCW